MTQPPPETAERRRSQRISLSVPIVVRSLDFPPTFRGNLHTVEVSGHGCVLHALQPFKRNSRLRLDILHHNRTTTARVVHSEPSGPRVTKWKVALELDKPGNFWSLSAPPPDWLETSQQQSSRKSPGCDSVRDTEIEN